LISNQKNGPLLTNNHGGETAFEVLMYDHELDASITDFEGIFGLGLPYDDVGFEKSSWLTTAAWPSRGKYEKCHG